MVDIFSRWYFKNQLSTGPKLWYDITGRGEGTHNKKQPARGDTHNKKTVKEVILYQNQSM